MCVQIMCNEQPLLLKGWRDGSHHSRHAPALANGQYPVRIRVSYRRVRSYYPTGKSMMPDDWERLNATRLHSLVSVRKDIENSFELVRQAVEGFNV